MKAFVVFPRHYFEHKMSIVRRDIVRCMQRRGGVLTGPGWDSWRDHETLQMNRDRIAPETDYVFWYKPGGGGPKDGVKPIEILNQSVPSVMAFNECWWPDFKAQREVLESKTRLVVCHHENDINRFPLAGKPLPTPRNDGMKRFDVVHIPHCVDPQWFPEHAASQRRKTRLILTGVLSPEFYPLRCEVVRAIERGKIDGKVRRHPGYRLGHVGACDTQARAYAFDLMQSEASFCDGSKFEYSLAKYVESWAAGCCVIGPRPRDSRYDRTFGDLHLEANTVEEVERIMREITRAELRKWGEEGRRRAIATRNPDCYVEELETAIAAL